MKALKEFIQFIQGPAYHVEREYDYRAEIDSEVPLNIQLFEAAEAGYGNLTQCLLDCGADANAIAKQGDLIFSEEGHTPLLAACSSIGKFGLLEKRSWKKYTPDYFQVVTSLVERGADVNFQDQKGNTPLFYLAEKKAASMVSYLLEKKANPNHVNNFGQAIIHAAIIGGEIAIVELLLAHGAKIQNEFTSTDEYLQEMLVRKDYLDFDNFLKQKGQTSLTLAVLHNQVAMAEWLLHYGVDINQCNLYGISPVQLAILNGDSLRMVHLLIENDADLYGNQTKVDPMLLAFKSHGLDSLAILQYLICDCNLPYPKEWGREDFHPIQPISFFCLSLRVAPDSAPMRSRVLFDESAEIAYALSRMGLALGHPQTLSAQESNQAIWNFLTLPIKSTSQAKRAKLCLMKFLFAFDIPEFVQGITQLDTEMLSAAMTYGAKQCLAHFSKKILIPIENVTPLSIKFSVKSCELIDDYLALQSGDNKILLLHNCEFSEEVWQSFIVKLQNSRHISNITHFAIVGCHLTSERMRALIPIICNMKQLSELDLSRNYFSYGALRNLLYHIHRQGLPHLSLFSARHNRIEIYNDPNAIEKIRSELESHFVKSLKKIDISENYIDMPFEANVDVGLSNYLNCHRLFHVDPASNCSSLLFPYRKLTVAKGIIYLFVYNRHMQIGWEILSESGQRVLKIAHLQYDSQRAITINYWGDLDRLNGYIKKSHVVSFAATKTQVRSLSRDIAQQVELPPKVEYRKFIISTNDDGQQNCVSWALARLNQHANLNLKPIPGNIPSLTIQSFKLHPRRLDYIEPEQHLPSRLFTVPLGELKEDHEVEPSFHHPHGEI